MIPGEAENGVGMNRSVREGKKSVKRFERSNGLDTALYKNYLYLFLQCYGMGAPIHLLRRLQINTIAVM